jgi:hypothetical protein
MKSKFNFLVVILTFAFLTANADVEKKKEFHQKWAAGSVETLKVINKFGEIKVQNNGGQDITVDVVVKVETSSESRTEKILSQIDITFSKEGNVAKAATSFEDEFNGPNKFSVDYTINIPADKNLDIENKFGNVIIDELKAKGKFSIDYGSLTANKLIGKTSEDIDIDLKYSRASIENLSDAVLNVKYCQPFNISLANNLKIESNYSSLSIESIKSANIDSKYDNYSIGEIGSLTANTKYTQVKIDELKKALKINTGYGSIKVAEVSAGFELIDVENSYGAVSLGIGDNVSYDVKASCDYCDIEYNKEKFKGNRISDNHSKNIEGRVGSGVGTAKVVVNSRYGGITLR